MNFISFFPGDELSIHDHELVLLKDTAHDNENDEDFHMLNKYPQDQNISPISRSLSESDLSELCLTATGDAAIGGGGINSPHTLHGSIPPSDDETHHLLQYDDDEIHQLQQHNNLNNSRRAHHAREVVVPVSVEGSAHNHNGPTQQLPIDEGDRYDEHQYSALSTRKTLPPPPILPPKKGFNREQNVHAPRTYHHQIHDNAELPYHNNSSSDRNNENLNQHAKSHHHRLNKMTSHEQHSNELKNNFDAAKKQQHSSTLHEHQQRHNHANYHHFNEHQFNTLGSNSGSSCSSSERRNFNNNNNRAYQNNIFNEGKKF